MSTTFAINWDYKCPFARNAHEHLVTALKAGADWNVDFIPFSLTQTHIPEDHPSVFEDPDRSDDLLAVSTGLVVKELYPELFLDFHVSMFAARHDKGNDISDWNVISSVLSEFDIDSTKVMEQIDAGWPRDRYREGHMESVEAYQVFGVPTIFAAGTGTFVRVMTRPSDDAAYSTRLLGRVLESILDFPELNEVKQTQIAR